MSIRLIVAEPCAPQFVYLKKWEGKGLSIDAKQMMREIERVKFRRKRQFMKTMPKKGNGVVA